MGNGCDAMSKHSMPDGPGKDNLITAVQAAVVTTINTLGGTLLGADLTPITKSPIPDDEGRANPRKRSRAQARRVAGVHGLP
jgi:hypothetical protein